jgi:stage V sporulation protein G
MDIRSEVYVVENPTNKVVGTATIIIDECFVVKGLKIFDGANGFFVSMPNKKAQEGEYKDIAFPITKEAREQITQTVLQEYERKLNETPKTNNSDDLPF